MAELAERRKAPAPREPVAVKLAYNQAEAAEALSMSVNTFRVAVQPYVKCVHVGVSGRRRLFPATELQAWLDRHGRKS